MYKRDLTLNKQQELIYHTNPTNQSFGNFSRFSNVAVRVRFSLQYYYIVVRDIYF